MASPEPFWLFIIGLIFFVGVLIRNVFKFSSVRTDQLKNYYLWALIINVTLIVSLLFGLFNQYLPFAILFFGIMIVAMFRYGKSIKAQREEAEKVMVKVRDQKLVISDMFTGKGWIKMAFKFGAARATAITFCIGFVILLVLLLETPDGVENVVVEDGSILTILHQDAQEILLENPQPLIL